MSKNYTDNANIFKALGDENRLKILELLLNGEKCVNELLEDVSIGQSTLSHHIKLMCVSGIIKSRKAGTATYYSINPEGAQAAVSILAELTGIDTVKQKENTVETETNNTEPASIVRQKGSRPNGWLL